MTLTPAQANALRSPCRTPDDQADPDFGYWWREGDLIITLVLTVDVGQSGGFVPPGMGPASWHVSTGIRLDPEHVGDDTTGVFPEGIGPLPTDLWTPAMARAGARACASALEGVGRPGELYYYRGLSTIQGWRRLTDPEFERLGVLARAT